jgi:hypothetical protein
MRTLSLHYRRGHGFDVRDDGKVIASEVGVATLSAFLLSASRCVGEVAGRHARGLPVRSVVDLLRKVAS